LGFQLAGHLYYQLHASKTAQVFWYRYRGLKKKKNLPHQDRAINKFSGAVAGEKEDFCKGSFAHTSFTLF
jgi:hypothetical protein